MRTKPLPDAPAPGFSLSAAALRQLDHLQINASRYLAGHRQGMRPSLRRRPSSDFLEHRPYTSGDDVRFVDWKASARQEHVFVKQGDFPKDATVALFLDCSASMAWGDPPKSTTAFSLAMALAYMTLAQGDRLIVLPYSDQASLLPLGPLSGKNQIPGVFNYLRSIRFTGGANLNAAVQQFIRQKAIPSGLVFVLSDFLGEDQLSSVLDRFPVPLWQMVMFHLLHPEELDPRPLGNVEIQDVETGAAVNYDVTPKELKAYREHIQSWQAGLEMSCVEHFAQYTLIPTNWRLEKEILAHLLKTNLVRPL